MVVDDDGPHRRLMTIQLEEEGFEVRTFANGEECLANVVAYDPDVILLDIQMPGLNGIETCRRLKDKAETQHIPVLFMTGHKDDDQTTVEALRAGGNDFISKDASQAVLHTRVACQVTINRSQRQLRKIAMTDELTGLFSRRFLFDSLRRAVKSTGRTRDQRGVACLLADLDHFKRINDTLGHLKGDEALRAVAGVITKTIRETDIAGRFGGEEFVIVLCDADAAGAAQVGENIRAAVEKSCPVTLSVGVALVPPLSLSELRSSRAMDAIVEKLVHQADTAMYASKAAGRNRVTVWHPGLA